MSPEAQRIAIAEACPTLFRVMKESRELCWVPPGHQYEHDVDPLSDLNAMHEAEKTLTGEQWYTFVQSVVGKSWFDAWAFDDIRRLMPATAAQRAEAFLRASGKWVESEVSA